MSESNGRPTPAQAARLMKNANRRRVFEALGGEIKSPAVIAREIGLPVNLVAYHMHLLANAGAAELTHTTPRRGSTEHFFRALVKIDEVATGEAKLVIRRDEGEDKTFYEVPVKVTVRAYPGRRRVR